MSNSQIFISKFDNERIRNREAGRIERKREELVVLSIFSRILPTYYDNDSADDANKKRKKESLRLTRFHAFDRQAKLSIELI